MLQSDTFGIIFDAELSNPTLLIQCVALYFLEALSTSEAEIFADY